MSELSVIEEFVKTFVSDNRQERILTLSGKQKDRTKLGRILGNSDIFKEAFVHQIIPKQQNVNSIYEILKAKGAGPYCTLYSERLQWDGRMLELKEAIQKILGYGIATVIICDPHRLAFFEGEDRIRFILETDCKKTFKKEAYHRP
jgi:hypothetical protein